MEHEKQCLQLLSLIQFLFHAQTRKGSFTTLSFSFKVSTISALALKVLIENLGDIQLDSQKWSMEVSIWSPCFLRLTLLNKRKKGSISLRKLHMTSGLMNGNGNILEVK